MKLSFGFLMFLMTYVFNWLMICCKYSAHQWGGKVNHFERNFCDRYSGKYLSIELEGTTARWCTTPLPGNDVKFTCCLALDPDRSPSFSYYLNISISWWLYSPCIFGPLFRRPNIEAHQVASQCPPINNLPSVKEKKTNQMQGPFILQDITEMICSEHFYKEIAII